MNQIRIRKYCAIIYGQHLYSTLAWNPVQAATLFKSCLKYGKEEQRTLYYQWKSCGKEMAEHILPEWAN